MNRRKRWLTYTLLFLCIGGIAITYSWTFTPHGRLDYRAALSLHLLTFERTLVPDPGSDFEFSIPVNLVFGLSAMLPSAKAAEVKDLVVPSEARDIPVRVYWPERVDNAPPPIIVYFHGGGFVVGSVDIFDGLARSLSRATKSIVVSVEYSLAPAHPWPAAVEDCYAALAWAATHAGELGGDADQLVVAGDSAGGNLAAVTALKARGLGGPEITAQVLYYPVTDLTEKRYDSLEKFSDGYGLSTEARQAFRAAYVGHIRDRSNPLVSPLYAPALANLPPAMVVTAGFDPLTDSAQAYAGRLSRAGVTVHSRHFPAMIHGFMSVALFSQRNEALEETASFLDEVLGSREGNEQDARGAELGGIEGQ